MAEFNGEVEGHGASWGNVITRPLLASCWSWETSSYPLLNNHHLSQTASEHDVLRWTSNSHWLWTSCMCLEHIIVTSYAWGQAYHSASRIMQLLSSRATPKHFSIKMSIEQYSILLHLQEAVWSIIWSWIYCGLLQEIRNQYLEKMEETLLHC